MEKRQVKRKLQEEQKKAFSIQATVFTLITSYLFLLSLEDSSQGGFQVIFGISSLLGAYGLLNL